MISVTDFMRNNSIYEGNTRKFGITIGGENYIVKFPKDNDLSVYCEYIASNFINRMGIPCQQVELGNYKGNTVDVIYDFASNNDLYLHSFRDTKQSSADTDIGEKEYTYADVTYLIEKHLKLLDEDKEKTQAQFWQMFICDAILANRDRHWGNWGYLGRDGSNYYIPAPIYDNGASLFPGIEAATGHMDDDREKFFAERVFTFPASLFKIKRPDKSYRTNYYEMFSDLRINKNFARETRKLKEMYSYADVFNMAVEIVMNSEIPLSHRVLEFWIEIITLRYMCIINRKDFQKSFAVVEKMIQMVR